MPHKTHREIAQELELRWQKAFVESVLLFFFASGWLIIISHPRQLWHAGRQNKKKISILFGTGNTSSTFQSHHVKVCTYWHLTPPQTMYTAPLSSGKWKVRVSFTFYQQWMCFSYERNKHGTNLRGWLRLAITFLSEDLLICWKRGTEVV